MRSGRDLLARLRVRGAARLGGRRSDRFEPDPRLALRRLVHDLRLARALEAHVRLLPVRLHLRLRLRLRRHHLDPGLRNRDLHVGPHHRHVHVGGRHSHDDFRLGLLHGDRRRRLTHDDLGLRLAHGDTWLRLLHDDLRDGGGSSRRRLLRRRRGGRVLRVCRSGCRGGRRPGGGARVFSQAPQVVLTGLELGSPLPGTDLLQGHARIGGPGLLEIGDQPVAFGDGGLRVDGALRRHIRRDLRLLLRRGRSDEGCRTHEGGEKGGPHRRSPFRGRIAGWHGTGASCWGDNLARLRPVPRKAAGPRPAE